LNLAIRGIRKESIEIPSIVIFPSVTTAKNNIAWRVLSEFRRIEETRKKMDEIGLLT